jgi:fumarylacetoacetate (FAA) hydrolase family protein
VPGQDFTLTPGDRVRIRVDEVGTLANDVLPTPEIR